MDAETLRAQYERLVNLGMPKLPTIWWNDGQKGFVARDGFNVAEGVPTFGDGWKAIPIEEAVSAVNQWAKGWFSNHSTGGCVRPTNGGQGFEASRFPKDVTWDFGDHAQREWVAGSSALDAIANEIDKNGPIEN